VGRKSICAGFLSLMLLACVSPAAQAAYPGENGRIAFISAGEIWTINPDGTAPRQVTSPTPPLSDSAPSWSPDGTRIAFARGNPCCVARDIFVVNSDGSGERLLRSNGISPTWSPDGTEIAFEVRTFSELWRMNADGTNARLEAVPDGYEWDFEEPAWSANGDAIAFGITSDVPYSDHDGGYYTVEHSDLGVRYLPGPEPEAHATRPGGSDPEWSPDGTELVYVARQISQPIDIKARNADGSGAPRTIVGGPDDRSPAWSPDGSKIVFHRSTAGAAGLWVVGADGSNPTRILEVGNQPDARPAGATPVRVSLVPAFAQCTSSNRTHGPPLAFPSCNPPQAGSPNIAVSNGEQRIGSVGYLRVGVLAGEPGGADDADLGLIFRITNVFNKSGLTDYTGVLQPELVVRLTDRQGFQSQTTQDFPFRYSVPCVATDTPAGATCALTTSAEAIVPGSVTEGARAIWALDKARVYDGGPSGDGADASLFATQGIFVP
jgi:Tol biopolymer transport system component